MLSFASATGNLFPRLGKIGALPKNARNAQNTQTTAMINTTTGVVAQFNAESDIQAIMGSSYIGILNSMGGNIGGTVQTLFQSTINRMIFRDNPQLGQTLTSSNLLVSLVQVIYQMRVAGASVLAMTVTTTPTVFIGEGNGIIVSTPKRAFDGLVMENSFAENLTVQCTVDSYNGGATEGNETLSVTGTGSQNDVFAFNWPLGSNASITLQAIDGNSDNSNGNILTNSGFEEWTSDVPDNWSLVTGTAGTNIFEENSLNYDGEHSCRFLGDGSTLTCIKQEFDITTGTSGTLDPQTQYSWNIWARRDGVTPAAGILTIDLVDENNTVILDANANPNTTTIDCTTLTVEYAAYNVAFRTPVIMPSQYFIRIRFTTALTNGRSVYIDKGGLGLMSQVYVSGPFASVFAGSIPFVQGDTGAIAVTNSRGAAGTLDTFQTLFARAVPAMYSSQLLLPSSATPTISDTLIG